MKRGPILNNYWETGRARAGRTYPTKISGRKSKLLIAAVVLISLCAVSAFVLETDDTSADPDVYVDNVSELSDAMLNASTDVCIGLTADFANDLMNNGTTAITVTHDHNITIYGDTTLTALTGGLHFNIVNNGTGTIRFESVNLVNTGGYANTGGMQLQGGSWEFINCSFSGLTKTAITFIGNKNNASFTDCTFSNNSSRALILAGGTVGNIANYEFSNCLFRGNTITGTSGGGAIYIWASYFNLNFTGCVFAENKAIGTGTTSGSNNRVDGGALYVNASYGQEGSLSVFNSYFENNFAQDDGGAILVEGSQTSVSVKSNIVNSTFYGNTAAGAWYGNSLMKITDGCGGAVCYFALTDSEITHCTFYNNGITNQIPGANSNGSVGGGGAIAVDAGQDITALASLPPVPKLTNNVFVGNYIVSPASQTTINLINNFTGNGLGDIQDRQKTGNIFIFRACDADLQGYQQGMDPRMFENNGNIGYDNGIWDTDRNSKPNNYTNNGISTIEGVLVKNVFANYNSVTNRGDPNTALSTEYGDPVGAAGSNVYKKCFIVSPTSNELYRGGSVPYAVEVPYDTLGNKRDTFPNAGAVEIYWTMFKPGTNANWTAAVPTEVDDPNNPGEIFDVIKSLNFATNNGYYVMTAVGVQDSPSGYTIAMPRSAIEPSDPSYGFLGWRSNLPDLNWIDYAQWATDNGYAELTVQEFLSNYPASDLPLDAFPLYQPGDTVLSEKQTLTAEWYQDLYRVDFDLNYDVTPNWYNSSEPGKEAPRLSVPSGSAILAPLDPIRTDYVFNGWYKDATCTQAWHFNVDIVTTDIVLYAMWKEADNKNPQNSYTITATADVGSSISPSGAVTLWPGENKTFVFSAKPGFQIKAVYVDGKEISFTELASGKYTFININSNHTINVVSKAGVGSGDDIGGGIGGNGDSTVNGGNGKWAVLNLICAVIAVFTGAIAVIAGWERLRNDDGEKGSKTALLLRLLALIIGIVSVLVFFLTEDWSLPVEPADGWTLLMFILFLATLILTVISFKFDDAENDANGGGET